MSDEHDAPSLRPRAHNTVQIIGDMFHRPAEIVWKSDHGRVRVDQFLTGGYDAVRG